MEKVLAVLVIGLLVLALVCFGYAVGIIAGFVAFAEWRLLLLFAGCCCIMAAMGIMAAMIGD